MSPFKKERQEVLSSYPCFYYSIPSLKNNKEKGLFLLLIVLIFSFLLIVFAGWPNYDYYEKYKPDIVILDIIREKKEIDWSLFLLAWSKIQENFIYFDEIDKDKMNTAITETIANFIYDNQINEKEINIAVIKTMIDELNCPFSRFQIAPYPQAVVREIGITIEKRETRVRVISVEEDSPSENKIIIGDELIYINNKGVKDLTFEDVVRNLEGKPGTEVKLSLSRIGYKDLKIFKIIRREILPIPPPPTVEWELKDDDIAYIKIFQFMGDLYFDFYQVIDEVLESPADKIILDLRNNPGGDMGIVKRVSEHFLKQNDIILIEKRPGKIIKHRSKKIGKLSEMNIIVLINSRSVSGAEIMAATLRDNRNAILIGEKSFGKASIQRGFHLKDRYSIIITTDVWLTPQKKSINIVGITPNYLIVDPYQQLNKALELLN